ncbi:S-adenosylmethionine:tRNA ribosyltransferase-isomerase [Flavilitoribacter nigricans]|uniref:S-adenosylmethionine tRNA ribosyltransferase n=1 Tax=Flavilitoribacter nigricans (strain ATCC 23147 / DSM 23189 / NBRC 102662 / NCIMB 1420 / SS-2) TaxID=1122177 RepID=A0A2D0N9Z9_FLAN2|nr:S-adenosylmethionine:tRNA ribosyltransferase-isomerase [Flavilitoribacter nigricans]PHN04969.1 S-adenosylmethionine tRNA ribosyltransferase [Flavilitoribacter nigricans DSM 23189 = NBRC 102662]
MSTPKHIEIADYTYDLPDDRIAQYPLAERDDARLLVYRDGQISASDFKHLRDQLPDRSLLVFNDTRVIHARLHFTLPNGKLLEIFCLEPLQPAEYQQNFGASGSVRWKCLIGGNRKWKSGVIESSIPGPEGIFTLQAERIGRLEDAFEVAFSWTADLSFGEVLHAAGVIPLPPYMQRASEAADADRYQTVYARLDGSVAAPTAGLHFTDRVFRDMDAKQIDRLFVTLHVGAGTFKPVKSEKIGDHHMHQESIYLSLDDVQVLLDSVAAGRKIISVGTTSTRLLESIYWHGCMLLQQQSAPDAPIDVPQWAPYELAAHQYSATEALAAVREQIRALPDQLLTGQTQVMIAPGYTFRIIDGLITNFHQPNSTLLLLVAALIGPDWKKVYQYALEHDFRFLSYGDGSLLWAAAPTGA